MFSAAEPNAEALLRTSAAMRVGYLGRNAATPPTTPATTQMMQMIFSRE